MSATKRMFGAVFALMFALLASIGIAVSPAYAGEYSQSLTLTGLADGETVQVYKVMSYGSDYNTYTYDTTAADGKTSFDSYLQTAADKASKSKDEYLASLSSSSTPTLSNFLATYLYGTATYAKPAAAETAVSGTSAQLALDPGYYIISIKTTAAESNVYTPFSVFVKMDGNKSTIKAGDGDEGTSTVAMKSTKGASIEKKVMRANGTDMDSTWKSTKTVTVGETITYRVKLTVPNWDNTTTPRLVLSDSLVNQQYTSGSVKIFAEEGSQASDYKPAAAVEGCITEGTIGAYANGTQGVEFNIDSQKLTGGATYYITYTTQVMSDITGAANTGDSKATNTAKVKYSTSDTSYSETTASSTTLYTYSAKLTKKDMNEDLLQGSGFTVYSDEACTQAIKFEKVSTGADSYYYRPSATGSVTEIEANGEEAYLLIKGLDPYKDYYFKETTTPKGYYAPSGAFKLDLASQMKAEDATEHSGNLSGDSTVTAVNDADSALVSGNVDNDHANQFDIVIKNSSTPSLPTTGGMGTVLFTVAGLALMLVAVGVYLARRRKRNN